MSVTELTFGVRLIQCKDCDRVEIVRCKDCLSWQFLYEDVGLCVVDVPDVDGVLRCDLDYCSYGERKDNG